MRTNNLFICLNDSISSITLSYFIISPFYTYSNPLYLNRYPGIKRGRSSGQAGFLIMEEFEKIAEQYTPLIHHMIKRLNIYRDKDEFIQIGLIALWEASKAYDSAKGQFMSYAFMTIKGRMLSHMQKSNKIQIREQLKEAGMDHLIQDEEMMHMLDWLIPKAFLETLTSNQSCWLIHHIQYGKTTREIAADCQTTTASVKSWKRITIKKLQAYYRQHPEAF